MKVLFLGEIVGRAGLSAVKNCLRPLMKERGIDLVIANAEGTTSGFGIGVQHAMTLFKYGVDIITGAEKIFYKPDMQDFAGRKDRILRPANLPEGCPGRGARFYNVGDRKAYVINLMGQSDMPLHPGNPFNLAEYLIEKAGKETRDIFVVFHASTTAERCAMGYMLDGKASAVIGTHTKVLTADARLLPRGTAYISDNGRCGSFESVGGFLPENEVRKFESANFVRSFETFADSRLQGVVVTTGNDGRAVSVETINIKDTKQTETEN